MGTGSVAPRARFHIIPPTLRYCCPVGCPVGMTEKIDVLDHVKNGQSSALPRGLPRGDFTPLETFNHLNLIPLTIVPLHCTVLDRWLRWRA